MNLYARCEYELAVQSHSTQAKSTPRMYRLAHLSDIHLSPLPWGGLGDYMGKRTLGLLSWHLRRKKVHKKFILEKIVADMKAAHW